MTDHDDTAPRQDPADAQDPALQDVAERVRRVLRSDQMRPAFRDRLRAQLVASRDETIAARPAPAAPPAAPADASPAASAPAAPRARRRRVRHRGRGAGPGPGRRGPRAPAGPVETRSGGAARRRRRAVAGWVGAAAVAVVAVAAGLGYGIASRGGAGGGPAAVAVVARSDVGGALSADPAAPLVLRFSQPLDHAATESALQLSPAAAVRTAWQGDQLSVAPLHGFAPNSAYVLTIDRTVARTAGGAPLAADVHVVFGTAGVAGIGPAAGPPVALPRTRVAPAADGSEAAVGVDGTLLLTAAEASGGGSGGLLRVDGGTADRLAAATDAICVSRSGQSVAYLAAGGSGTEVVFADGRGNAQRRSPVAADPGSPLGWIGDTQVSFIGGRRLRAVDRAGTVRVLSDTPIDAAHDSLAISPGGRFVYLAHGSAGAGRLLDLQTRLSHPLPGSAGEVAFSADGATVVWIDGRSGRPRLATAASAGGPVLTAALPVGAGDQVSDLGVSPDGSLLAYTLTRPDGAAELRLASLPEGDTLAVSTAGAGESPNWSPSGRLFTVLGHRAGGSEIEMVPVPDRVADRQAALEGTVAAFANAQISADAGSQRALAAADAVLPQLPRENPVGRATVLWVLPAADGDATARVRLTADPTPGRPVAVTAEETLTLNMPAGHPPTVRAVALGPFRAATAGPQLTHLDTDATPGAVTLTFDSDLDPATVSAARLTTPGGAPIAATARYDAATRTVTLRPPAGADPTLLLGIDRTLRDVAGHPPPAALNLTVTLDG
jgi:hypothetical protein